MHNHLQLIRRLAVVLSAVITIVWAGLQLYRVNMAEELADVVEYCETYIPYRHGDKPCPTTIDYVDLWTATLFPTLIAALIVCLVTVCLVAATQYALGRSTCTNRHCKCANHMQHPQYSIIATVVAVLMLATVIVIVSMVGLVA